MKDQLIKSLFVIVIMFAPYLVKADEGQKLFNQYCAVCHTIGNGRLVGPDLRNISENRAEEWLIGFIQSSQSMIKSGDVDAINIFEEYNKMLMPDQPLDDNQSKQVLNYIRKVSQGAIVETDKEAKTIDLLANTTDENVNEGLLLFGGKQKFSNGGASCISCHKVKDDRIFSYGTLAKDLSETWGMMGSAGIAAILKSPPFPVMNEVYANNPLSETEILNLTAYLKSVNDERIYQHPREFNTAFVILGAVIFVIILISIVILYFKRKRLSVNHEIHNRQSAVVN